MIDLSGVRVTGPLSPFAAGFAVELRRQGYAPGSAVNRLRLLAHLSRWLAEEGLDLHRLSQVEAERFLKARRASGYSNYRSSGSLTPLLAYLRGLGVVPIPPPAPAPAGDVEELLGRYRRYLILERGFKELTAEDYARAVRPFLSERVSPEGLGLDRLSVADVTAFAVASFPRQSRGRAKKTVVALRSLLRFLHLQGAILDRWPLRFPRSLDGGWQGCRGGWSQPRRKAFWPPATATPCKGVVTSRSSPCSCGLGCGPGRSRHLGSTTSTGGRAGGRDRCARQGWARGALATAGRCRRGDRCLSA
jgi:hypothetical protein